MKISEGYPQILLARWCTSLWKGTKISGQVANELAAANIPVIFTAAHGAPVKWEEKDMLVGLPLTKSPVQVLHEANVTFALALPYFSKFASLASHLPTKKFGRDICKRPRDNREPKEGDALSTG